MKVFMANWKLNGNKKWIDSFFLGLKQHNFKTTNRNTIIFPPVCYIDYINKKYQDLGILFGAQDVSQFARGSFTGEVSFSMLEDIGCSYVLLGHSERRTLMEDSEEKILAKLNLLKQSHLKVVLCIGENIEEKNDGKTFTVLARQIQSASKAFKDNDVAFAYEPLWAIGSGKIPTLDDIKEVMSFIQEKTSNYFAKKPQVLYGGSVSSDNCADICYKALADGVLVGGASLKVNEFIGIANSLNKS